MKRRDPLSLSTRGQPRWLLLGSGVCLALALLASLPGRASAQRHGEDEGAERDRHRHQPRQHQPRGERHRPAGAGADLDPRAAAAAAAAAGGDPAAAAAAAAAAGGAAPGIPGLPEGVVPRILVIPERRTPRSLTREVRRILGATGRLVNTDDFVRQARARGLRPDQPEAVPAVYADEPDSVHLVAVISRQRRGRRGRALRLIYRAPTGETLLEELHDLHGSDIEEGASERILSEAQLTLRMIMMSMHPPGAEDQQERPDHPDRPELPDGVDPRMLMNRGTAIHVGIAAGVGIGTRNIDVPTNAGPLRLELVAFPAIALQLGVAIEPTALGQVAVGGQIEYRSSIGLVTRDLRIDGSTRQTDSRSHLLQALAFISYRFDEMDPYGPFLLTSLGWSSRLFGSEAPVSMPDFGLGGLMLSVGLWIPVERRLITFTIAPEVQWLVDVSDSIQAFGASAMGVAIGGTARVTFKLNNSFFIQLAYRESHALIDGTNGQVNDGERFGTVRLFYRP